MTTQTVRKDIMDEMQTRLAEIVAGQVYGTTIVTVERHRDTDAEPFEIDECPAINIRDGRCPVTHYASNDEHDLAVSIEIHAVKSTNAAEAEELLADVMTCIDRNGTWGGHADGTNIDEHNIELQQVGDTIVAATVELTVHYTTEKGKI